MKGDPAIARPYADAAYGHAAAKGRVGDWEAALLALSDLIAVPLFADAMRRPGVGANRLNELTASALGGDLDPEFANFVKVVVGNGRLDQAGAICERFLELKLRDESTLRVSVQAAFPLDDADLRRLEEDLSSKRPGARRIEFDVRVDPDLIGGARVQVGDDVVDLSLRNQLEQLSRSIRH